MIPQKVFNYFSENHRISLLESEYEDIKNVIFEEEKKASSICGSCLNFALLRGKSYCMKKDNTVIECNGKYYEESAVTSTNSTMPVSPKPPCWNYCDNYVELRKCEAATVPGVDRCAFDDKLPFGNTAAS
jgi:hypothetical protein